MKAHREVFIHSSSLKDEEFIAIFRSFAAESNEWSLMVPQSREYSNFAGVPSCMILYKRHPLKPALALTKKWPGTYFVPNIVPAAGLEGLSLDEFNVIAESFATALRAHLRAKTLRPSIQVTDDNIDLPDIIKGVKLRERFQSYLRGYPRTFHPSDLEQLDRFTCALAGCPRAKVDLFRLQGYLVENLKWTPSEARACIERVEIGLDVLKVRGRR